MSLKSVSNLYIEKRTTIINNKNHFKIVNYFEFIINGEKPYPYGDIVDITNFKASLISNGIYYIFNCSCGIPECAGRTKGIKVTHINDSLIWEDLDYNKKWLFNIHQIKTSLDNIKKEELKSKNYFNKKGVDFIPVLIP